MLMRNDIYEHIEKLIREFSEIWGHEDTDVSKDPVIKLLLAAMAFETLDIKQEIKKTDKNTATFFRDMILPFEYTRARPALSISHIKLNDKQNETIIIDGKANLIYEKKGKNDKEKYIYNFKPLIKTPLIPAEIKFRLQNNNLYEYSKKGKKALTKTREHTSQDIWLGIKLKEGFQDINSFSLYFDYQLRSATTVYPFNLTLDIQDVNIPVKHITELDRKQFVSGFNAEQSADALYGDVDFFGIDNSMLLFYVDVRDSFIPETRLYPEVFNRFFQEKELTNFFSEELLWLHIHIYGNLPHADTEIYLNCCPVVNVEEETVYLNLSNPIERLPQNTQKQFLSLLTEQNGFILRDFSTERFNPQQLQNQIQELYNRFMTDYYAFKSCLSEGKELNILNKAMRDIYAHMLSEKTDTFTGYYAVFSPDSGTQNIPVTFLYTDGKNANRIGKGEKLSLKKAVPGIDGATMIMESVGGKDEAGSKEKEYIAHYRLLSGNRLVTKEDMKAFCFKELGKELQSASVTTGAVGTPNGLSRGIIIDLLLMNQEQDDEYKLLLSNSLRLKIEQLSTSVFPVEIRVN